MAFKLFTRTYPHDFQAGVESQWTNDGQRFLLENFDTIQASPSHIYHSALPLSPSSSWLHKHYSAGLSFTVKAVKGPSAEWGVCSRTVLLDSFTQTLSFWNKIIAVGSRHGDIIILNAVTGSRTAILSGHTAEVNTLTFSLDGTSLVSGSDDRTVKLWDLQTGGVVKTFLGHTDVVWSVSISADFTVIVSGSYDHTIRLWDIQTGECHQTIEQQKEVLHVCFSPTSFQYLISRSGGKVWQWDHNGHQIKPPCDGSCTAFSSDGTHFMSCNGAVVTIQNSDSGVIVTEFSVADSNTSHCCFSPDSRLVAVAADSTTYVWDITKSNPHLVETFIGHTNYITSLTFSSSSTLISTSRDQSIKFWHIGNLSTNPIATDPKSTSLTSVPITYIALQAKEGITITSDSNGMVRTWDISTGLCKACFQSPTKRFHRRDIQLINGRLIFVWCTNKKLGIWDFGKGDLLSAVDIPNELEDLKISGDGSRIFCLDEHSTQARSIETGEIVDKVDIRYSQEYGTLTVDGSKVWAHYPHSGYQGWDFGISGSSPVQLSSVPILPNSSMLWDPEESKIMDAVTEKVVFQLSGSLARPVIAKYDGCYLVAGYNSGEVLILKLNHVLL